MCSIFGVLDLKTDPVELRKKALECSRLMRHRGPDWSGVYADDHAILAHERLSIVDVNNGAQPLYNADHTSNHIFINVYQPKDSALWLHQVSLNV